MFRFAKPLRGRIWPLVSWIALMAGCAGGAPDREGVGASNDGSVTSPTKVRVSAAPDAGDEQAADGSSPDDTGLSTFDAAADASNSGDENPTAAVDADAGAVGAEAADVGAGGSDASNEAEPSDAGAAIDAAVAHDAADEPRPDAAPVADAGAPAPPPPPADAAVVVPEEPATLEQAGLYDDLPSRKLSPSVRAYQPAYALWSDGATKERYVYLPPGTQIDTSDPDHWSFPVGTRFYKSFFLQGKPIETRLLQKKADGTWFRTTYAWSTDGLSTSRLRDGAYNLLGLDYDIPDEAKCATCHNGAPDGVLGFEVIGLSSPGATGLTLAELNRLGLLSAPLTANYAIPGDSSTQAVLGYLHANCGNPCHNGTAGAEAVDTGFRMRLMVGALGKPQDTDTFKTGVGVMSKYQPGSSADYLRIVPGDPSRSAVSYRIGTRGTWDQMPPFDTNKVDSSFVPALAAWIAALPPD